SRAPREHRRLRGGPDQIRQRSLKQRAPAWQRRTPAPASAPRRLCLWAAAPRQALRQTRDRLSTRASKSPVRQKVDNGWVHAVQDQLRNKAEQDHESDDRCKRMALAVVQVREFLPVFGDRPAEDFLNDIEEHGGGDQQAKHRDGSGNPIERKDAAEDEKLADKAVKAGQSERGKKGEAHEPGEHRRGLAQTAEIEEPADSAGAQLDDGDKPEQRRGGETVVEHLQNNAVERGSLVGL